MGVVVGGSIRSASSANAHNQAAPSRSSATGVISQTIKSMSAEMTKSTSTQGAWFLSYATLYSFKFSGYQSTKGVE